MILTNLKNSYITEDKNIFECLDFNFPAMITAISKSSTSDEVEDKLKEKQIQFKRYKVMLLADSTAEQL